MPSDLKVTLFCSAAPRAEQLAGNWCRYLTNIEVHRTRATLAVLNVGVGAAAPQMANMDRDHGRRGGRS